MRVAMSKFLQGKKSFLQEMIQKLSKDFAYASVLGTDCSGKQYVVQRSGVSLRDAIWAERGFVVRVHNGINYSEYAFNEIPQGGADELIDNIKAHVSKELSKLKASGIEVSEYPVIDEEKVTDSFYAEVKSDMDSMNSKEKVARLVAIKDKGLKFSEGIIDFHVMYVDVHVSKIFISANKDLEQSYVFSEALVLPIARKGDQTKYCYEAFSGLKSIELFDEMEKAVSRCADLAIKLLDAEPPIPGEYDLICAPDVVGTIGHEAFGHGVEMDMFVRGRAKAADYINKEVASELVEMHDGAKSAYHVASYLFDDEGVIGKDTVIIKNGILKSGISDVLSALKLNTIPTGNGRRESYDRKAYARMTNTVLASGTDKLEDMIASIKYGYLIDKTMSGMEDPKNWGIQCMLVFGREIKDGKLTGKIVSPVIMTGYVPDLLKSISMVSSDIELFGTGACGKGHKELAKVSCGGPYIKVRGIIG